MSVTDLLLEGVNLMFLGMGMVFVFLTILVIAMNGMSRLARAITGPEVHETPSKPVAAPKATGEEGELVAVISAAISRFRSNKK
ncbi:MAG: hypothetical protein C0631_05145 [Sedimenticola sp.]|jgi:oxaloacetate decarboxylase gamma subunit|nr:MAG: hypothetical protein C0631_05145 [Sedimenticola sp.]